MADKRELLPFTSTSGQPVVVDVTRQDGQRYRLRLNVAVLSINDTGLINSDDLPQFEVQVHIPMVVEKVE